MHIPRVAAAPHNRPRLGGRFQGLFLQLGCFVVCRNVHGRMEGQRHALADLTGPHIHWDHLIFFAVQYFLHPELLPGVSLRQLTHPTLFPAICCGVPDKCRLWSCRRLPAHQQGSMLSGDMGRVVCPVCRDRFLCPAHHARGRSHRLFSLASSQAQCGPAQ
jgi:hypothetical protein